MVGFFTVCVCADSVWLIHGGRLGTVTPQISVRSCRGPLHVSTAARSLLTLCVLLRTLCNRSTGPRCARPVSADVVWLHQRQSAHPGLSFLPRCLEARSLHRGLHCTSCEERLTTTPVYVSGRPLNDGVGVGWGEVNHCFISGSMSYE